mgnify:CR=1 FL=1
MRLYDLTQDAKKDLQEIVRYTHKSWGRAQVEKYRNNLKKSFEDIGKSNIQLKRFSNKLNDVYVTKSARHFIFYLPSNDKKPIIFAILHESRDIISHLTSRLDE